MSGASAANDATTTKAIRDDSIKTPSAAQEGQNKKGPILEEDDEFEDFPVDDWADADTEAANAGPEGTAHLWEESWDDDDMNEDFAVMLKEELKKVEGKR